MLVRVVEPPLVPKPLLKTCLDLKVPQSKPLDKIRVHQDPKVLLDLDLDLILILMHHVR